MNVVMLRGPEHVERGAVAIETIGTAAIALGRGAQPKPYPHLDPNEDVVAAIAGPRAVCLIVADAHNGADAALAVVDSLLEQVGEDPPPQPSDDQLVAWFTAASQAAWRASRAHPYPRRGSRAAAGLVLVAPGEVTAAAVGDVAALLSDGQAQQLLNPPEPVFLGGPLEPAHVAGLLRRHRGPVPPGQWVVLASDGLLNFAPQGARDAVVNGSSDAPTVAERLVRLAYAGGAGDNVAVGVVAVAPGG